MVIYIFEKGDSEIIIFLNTFFSIMTKFDINERRKGIVFRLHRFKCIYDLSGLISCQDVPDKTCTGQKEHPLLALRVSLISS